MDDQLQQLIELQREQNQLLKRHLWRLRFSLLSLLIMTTITAVGLGLVAYQTRSAQLPPLPPAAAATPLYGPIRVAVPPMVPPPAVAPNGDIELRSMIPGQS